MLRSPKTLVQCCSFATVDSSFWKSAVVFACVYLLNFNTVGALCGIFLVSVLRFLSRVVKKFLRNCISKRVCSGSVNISAFLTRSRLYVCCINHTTVTRWLRRRNTDDVKTVTIRRGNSVNINSLALAKLSTGSMRYTVTAPLFSSTRTSRFTLLSGTTPTVGSLSVQGVIRPRHWLHFRLLFMGGFNQRHGEPASPNIFDFEVCGPGKTTEWWRSVTMMKRARKQQEQQQCLGIY